MERSAYFQEFWISALLITSFITYSESSHLLNPRRTSGRYLNIQDRVLESCRGHFMCEVFPYYDSFGLNCLNVSKVCDGTRHCQDGSDELPVICSGLGRSGNRTSSGSRQVVRGTGNRVVRIIRTGTSNNSASPTPDSNTHIEKLTATGGEASDQTLSGDLNKDMISTTTSYIASDSTTYPSIQNMQRTSSIVDSVSPSIRRRAQSQRGTIFDSLSRFMQSGNPFASFYTVVPNIERPRVFGSDYYTTQGRRRNLRRNSSMNESPSPMLRNRNPRRRNRNQQGNIAGVGNLNSILSEQFVNRRLSLPGSSYLDTAISTPPPNIPDGFVYKPGSEPHLAAEEQFLEQQFYLTNELPGAEQQRNRLPNEQNSLRNEQTNRLTQREQIAQQMQMSRSRQERLLRQQFFGLDPQTGNNDPNLERYGVSGPFDGGVPSVPGEIKELQNMDGSEANNAIHNVEALH